MSDSLFGQFEAATYDQWVSRVQKELAGQPLESLDWQPLEGVAVKPYYTGTPRLFEIESSNEWIVRQEIPASLPAAANRLAIEALKGGADALGFNAPLRHIEDLNSLLQGIQIEILWLHFSAGGSGLANLQILQQWLQETERNKNDLRGSLRQNLLQSQPAAACLETSAFCIAHLPLFKPFTIDAVALHQAGSHAVHDVAAALAWGNEYLHTLTEAGHSAATVNSQLVFRFAMGSSYFVEMAKLRAFAHLWRMLTKEYGQVCEPFMDAETSLYQQTAADVHNNLLRATTQAMSALLGGASSLCVHPYDASLEHRGESSMRLARNIHHLLRHESLLADARHAANGAYYIEELTGQIVNAAWALFQQIERKNGILNCTDWLWEQINQYGAQQKEKVQSGEFTVVGVNKYRDKSSVVPSNTSDRLTSHLE